MRDSAQMIARFVRSLSGVFPSLTDWQADEVSMHRYDEPEIGLSRHRDNLRFWGLVVVLTLEGSSDFVVYEGADEHVFTVGPGDLALMRATNLTGDPNDKIYQAENNPEHGVVNVTTLPRTSLIVRDNLRPHSSVSGFIYENWQPSLGT